MMGINYNDWVESTYQNCENPTEWNGKNPSCKLCDNEIEFMDEYCSEHQRCDECGEREICTDECKYQPLIQQYNRNREFKDFIYTINEIQ